MIEISVSNLEKSYSGTPLLNGLTFQIHQGERVGLLGRNGTGKTTLFNILAGSCDYNAGSVTLARHHKIGLIDQIPRDLRFCGFFFRFMRRRNASSS